MGLELFASPPADGLTVVKVPAGIDGAVLLTKLEKQYGMKLANGQDTLKGKILRLAHMGYIDQFDVLAALAGVELVLTKWAFRSSRARRGGGADECWARRIRHAG